MAHPAPAPRKLIIEEGGRHSTFEVLQDRIVVGRDSQADLVIPNQRISRRHCEIRQISSLLVVQDLESSNGTRVNGETVNIAELAPGDVISLAADVHLHVDEVAADAVPETVAEAPLIEEATTEMVALSRSQVSRPRVPMGAIVAGLAVVAAVILMMNMGSGGGSGETSTDGAPQSRVGKGRARLEAILASEDRVPPSDTRRQLELLLEEHRDTALGSAVRTELDAFLRRQRGSAQPVTPASGADVRSLFDDALRRGRFSEAKGLLAQMKGTTGLQARLESAMNTAAGAAQQQAKEIAADRGPRAAREYLRGRIADFPSNSTGWRRLQDQAAELGAKIAPRIAEADTKTTNENTGGTPDTTPGKPETGDVAVKSADEPRGKASLDHLMEQARRSRALVDDGHYAEARPVLEEVVRNAKTLKHRAVGEEAERALRFCTLQDELVAAIVTAGRAPGARLGRVGSPTGGTVDLREVTNAGLSVGAPGEEARLLRWRILPVTTFVRLSSRLQVPPRGQLGAGALLLRAEKVEEGEALLARLYRRDVELKPAIDRILADSREMAVPKEGFVLQDDRWLSPAQVARARLNNDIAALLASLESNDLEERELAFERLMGLGDAARSTLHRELVRSRSATFARIRKHGGFGRLDAVRKQFAELEKRRQHALELIFDTEKFPYPYRPPEASADAALAYRTNLPEVKRRIDAVYELWKKPAKATIAPAVRQDLTRVRHLDSLLVRGEFGDVPETDDDWLLHLPDDKSVSVQTFARNPSDRRRIDLSARIMKLNARKPGVAKVGERKQTQITNDYRVMMGRWALRLHDPLVKASRGHCQDMVRVGFFAHDSPVPGKRTPSDRVALEEVAPQGLSENIAISRGPQEAHRGWLNSPGHHRNILGPGWRIMGPGNSGSYWCQVFSGGDVNHPFDPEADTAEEK